MKNANYIIDIVPDGGSCGGEIVFQGTGKDMVGKQFNNNCKIY